MDHYQKILKKYYSEKKHNPKIKLEKRKKKLIDKLFIQIFLSSFVLLLLVIFNKYNFMDFNNKIQKNINFTILTKQVNLLLNDTEKVNNEITFELVNYHNNENTFVSTFNGVSAITEGVVTKIEKNNGLYNITILSSDDYEYTYYGLESTSCYLYEYITQGKIIGNVNFDQKYQYKVSIYKDGKYYEYK